MNEISNSSEMPLEQSSELQSSCQKIECSEIELLVDKSPEIHQATHRGYLEIVDGETSIPCAVLDNQKRIISQTGLFSVFKRPRKGEKRLEDLPSIVGAKNLLPYVTDELREKSQAVWYYHTNGRISSGYDAEIIPLICELYLKADEDDPRQLYPSQDKLVVRSRILVRALAKVGIIALIDEATGYQEDRERQDLQKLLSKFIREDYLKWQARFPRRFFQEIFRLHQWEYDPSSLKRPQYIGKFINKYVYEQMPQGVLDELRKKNPIQENGRRARKHHQHLTQDVGIPVLDRHLVKLITVMELSDSVEDFKNNFNRIFKQQDQLKLPLDMDSE